MLRQRFEAGYETREFLHLWMSVSSWRHRRSTPQAGAGQPTGCGVFAAEKRRKSLDSFSFEGNNDCLYYSKFL
jgi:hypothetical protein